MVFGRLIDILKAEIGSKFDDFQVDGKTYSQIDQEWESYINSKDESSADEPHFSAPQNTEEKAYYQALELPYGASFEEIKNAHKRLIKQYHPDKFQHDPKKQKSATELTKKLNIAYNYFREKHRKKNTN